MKRPVYLDYAATTPCDQEVLDEMIPYFTHKFGNPNSLHFYGMEALDALAEARERVAMLINSNFEEIVFTSGSTESNRIAICAQNKRVVTLKTEHKSVIDLCSNMGNNGIILDVMNNGKLDLDLLKKTIDENDDIGLVSICYINNETGVVQDIKKIVDICHAKGVLVHTDATQALCKIHIDVKELEVDFMSASGHKIYGPKGVGILYYNKKHHKLLHVKRANHAVEFGIRAGTIAVPLCIGFAKACSVTGSNISQNLEHIKELKNYLVNETKNNMEEIYINGDNEDNYPGIVNISFRGCEGEAIMMEASRICVSSGSACTSNKLTISHVLDAMHVPPDIAQSSIRVSIGKHTSMDDIKIAVEDLTAATNKLRDMSSVWEMIKQGLNIEDVFSGAACHR